MKLKPKSTTKNPKALLYRRFIDLEKSLNSSVVYLTRTFSGIIVTLKYWIFDNQSLEFLKVSTGVLTPNTKIIPITSYSTILNYKGNYFMYDDDLGWIKTTDLSGENITLLNASFNNIAKYQTNKYYFVGSFDFVLKGSIEGTTTQYIKGNIIPLTSLNIKHFDDEIKLSPDDLVVVDGHLYSVENPEIVVKQQPKPYKIYFATLNSIL